ncbi:MAG: aminoacyl-histidine dipeptidase [Lewinellaceae bacterium]|nr:aminoacyl-histidine dipeptidase [Lewinellaceae bacterium]
MSIRTLQPASLWNYFADLNAVPRPSKKEARVIAFIKSFGETLGLPTTVDEVGNVIIKKPASKGMENRATVVLQSHLDMVHQKNADTHFDFDAEGIRMRVDGDWVKAEGTTLGADNGIGVASIMAILASKDIQHPPLEALFTIDEETGMTGALSLKGGLLQAKYMLNLDTEDDTELTIGCAGGLDVTATGIYQMESAPTGMKGYQFSVKGLTGGHSGMDIHLGRGNANKLMNRLLLQAANEFELRVGSIDGGGLRNAIPRESVSMVAVPAGHAAAMEAWFKQEAAAIQAEYSHTDPSIKVSVTAADVPAQVMPLELQSRLLRAVQTAMNGIFRMSPDIAGLVQSSNNVARILVKDGAYTVMCLTRSAVNSEKMDLAHSLQSAFELAGATVQFSGAYPGWTPKPEATIVSLMRDLYHEMYSAEPHVNACHAGLECGILGANYPEMEMISFGPNIRGAHSPDETVQISSVQKYWRFLLETLQRIPEKGN